MPELPEVEVTKKSLAKHLQGRQIKRIDIRERRLRWPINSSQLRRLINQDILSLTRRGKYNFCLLYTSPSPRDRG